ncbi:MAG: ATP-binding protein [Gammaproteobacteria bacterium]
MNANVEPIRAAAKSSARPTAPAPKILLTPSQQAVYERLQEALTVSPIIGLVGPAGCGRTTIVQSLVAENGGRFIDMRDVYEAVEKVDGDKWEEAVEALVMEAFEYADLVIVDDYTSLMNVSFRSGVRPRFFANTVARRLFAATVELGKNLVLVGPAPHAWQSATDFFSDEAAIVTVKPFGLKDYAAFAANLLGADRVAGVDFKLVYRYASMLNGYQQRLVCQLLAHEKTLTAEKFIEYLEAYVLSSNTRIAEVEALSFDSLPGAEEIVDALETNIVLPFENRKLAQELGLKPKRGVLLFGPPGTGKTSIGRALAHRMKGKFFLIDGSFISEPPHQFFSKIQSVVAEAKENSPSVLFIDDADVLFRIEHIAGLVRYLLSLLDGLESETANNVCVMMTAMDVKKIPEALLRSGRVELWLETKPPGEETRGRILKRWMGTEIPGYEAIDYAALAKRTNGFTPADLRRIASDAKTLYAADIVAKQPVTNASEYLNRAAADVIADRNNMAAVLNDMSLRLGNRTVGV